MKDIIDRICEFARLENMPVFIGGYGAIDKNNPTSRGQYCYYFNRYAKTNTSDVNVVLAYWDNGVVGTNGHALFDRKTNTVTQTGDLLIWYIKSGYNLDSMPS